MIKLELSSATQHSPIPTQSNFLNWLQAVYLLPKTGQPIISIYLVDKPESARLNEQWRGKKNATNILSFPAGLSETSPVFLLGDLVICAPLVHEEAIAHNKIIEQHWAHLVIHGVLHLLGYDHIVESEALEMETLEIDIMRNLGYSNPYEVLLTTEVNKHHES